MERSAPYALIAAFVLLGLAVAAGLLIWLSDYDPWRRTASYAVVFGDVSGLGIASEVRYNGLPVGEVSDMALDPAGSGLIRVVIEVLEDVPLRQGSVARLAMQGVTGVAVVAVEGGNPDAAPLPVGPDGLPVLAAGRGTVETLADEAPVLLEEVRALVGNLRAFVTPENAERTRHILADLERGAAGLSEVGTLFEDLGGIGHDLAPALRNLPETLMAVEDAAREVEAFSGALRIFAEDRGSTLADAAQTGLGEIASVARAGRVQIDRAGSTLARIDEIADAALGQLAATRSTLEAFDSAARSVEIAADEIGAIASGMAPIASEIATSGARLATSAAATADQMAPLAGNAAALLDEARGGVATANAAIGRANDLLGQFASATSGLDRTIRKVAEAADEIGRLAEHLSRDPSSVIWGR